jgi:hypothetical protein
MTFRFELNELEPLSPTLEARVFHLEANLFLSLAFQTTPQNHES